MNRDTLSPWRGFDWLPPLAITALSPRERVARKGRVRGQFFV